MTFALEWPIVHSPMSATNMSLLEPSLLAMLVLRAKVAFTPGFTAVIFFRSDDFDQAVTGSVKFLAIFQDLWHLYSFLANIDVFDTLEDVFNSAFYDWHIR